MKAGVERWPHASCLGTSKKYCGSWSRLTLKPRLSFRNSFIEIQGTWENDFDDRSEKWQEGEAGQEAEERLGTLSEWLAAVAATGKIDVDQVL
jgi:hypothetical protein